MPRYSDDDDEISESASDFSANDNSDFDEPAPPVKAVKAKAPAKKPAAAAAKPATAKAKKTAVPKSERSEIELSSAIDNNSDELFSENAPPKPAANKKKTIEEIYQKKTQLEHILLRPDTYIGSVEALKQPMWVWDTQSLSIVMREITYVPGFFKIFDEILVNAADNKIRDPSMNTLKVEIDKENGVISVYNNGRGIPIEMHKEEKVYVPELIFGHLLTSSNYNDAERKVTGGRNGYGAKLCNIFSKEFIVETADKSSGKKYKQVFKNNMSVKGEPVISHPSRPEEFTKITFKPDFAKFGMSAIDDDTEALFMKRIYDLAGCVRDVKVYLNGERIAVQNFRQYVDLYLKGRDDDKFTSRPHVVVYESLNARWEIAFTVSDGQFQQASFVNSICTSKGGTHVSYVVDQIVTKLSESITKKNKAAPVKPFQIKNYVWIFINCLIENPAFDSQTKEHMTLKQGSFGSKVVIDDDFITKVKKSGIVEYVLEWAQGRQNQLLKKTDGSKRSRLTGITKLDDANNAGTKQGAKCTLILTEGDSAKTLAVTGLGVVGRDNYGVFPLRGKLLNVREASHKQIMENAEINHIKQILGLQHGKKYTDVSSLRYGHLMIMTDQDHDGSHIKGLIINFIDHFWPDLLRVEGFLCQFITPIVKVSKGKQEFTFYTLPEYETWKAANNEAKSWNIKYYKGLGTSTKEDARGYFRALDFHRKEFCEVDEEERSLIDMAFSKKKVDNRKDWLRHYQPGIFMDNSAETIHMSEFINKELILFSMADNIRSIPSMVDGLKPGLRKILYSCFKRNLVKDEVKVAQLVGYVAEHSAYHHGEASLMSSIIGMAQNFVGSNNLNLLEPRGQFGSRLQGGKDAASARYIFTRLAPLARKVFPKADDALLKYLNDDGQNIEPEWYVPILPMLLVNGGEGIGTGWSTFIPNYNPEDIVRNLYALMDGQEVTQMHPWYLGFKGDIVPQGQDKYLVSGTIQKTSPTTLEITELPVRTWTQSCKEYLETLVHGPASDKSSPGFIKDYKEYHSDTAVHFVISLSEENMQKAEEEGLEKRFKTTTSLSLNNMVCFDEEGRIKKYSNVNDILLEFYQLRLKFYHSRKEYLVGHLSDELSKLENRVKFVEEIIDGSLLVQNRKKSEIILTLKTRGYRPFSAKGEVTEDDADSATTTGGYDYLLSMPLWSLTYEKVDLMKKERDEKKAELNQLLGKTSKDLWRADLEEFLTEWRRFVVEVNEADSVKAAGTGKLGKKKAITAKKATAAAGKKSAAAVGDADEDDLFEDSDDDFELKFKQPVKPKPVTLGVSKKQTSIASYFKKAEPVTSKPVTVTSSSVLSSVADQEEAKFASLASSMSSLPRKRKETISSSEIEQASPSPKKPKSKLVGTKAKPVVFDSDSHNEDHSEPVKKPAAVKKIVKKEPVKKSTTTVAKKAQIVDSDDDDDLPDLKSMKVSKATSKVTKPPVKQPAKKTAVKSDSEMEDIDDVSDDDNQEPAVKVSRATRRPAAVKYVDLDSDDGDAGTDFTATQEESDFESEDDDD